MVISCSHCFSFSNVGICHWQLQLFTPESNKSKFFYDVTTTYRISPKLWHAVLTSRQTEEVTKVRWTPDRAVRVRTLAGPLRYVLEQNTLLSQSLSPFRSKNGCCQIVGETWQNAGKEVVLELLKLWACLDSQPARTKRVFSIRDNL